jgi:hypothetical protein
VEIEILDRVAGHVGDLDERLGTEIVLTGIRGGGHHDIAGADVGVERVHVDRALVLENADTDRLDVGSSLPSSSLPSPIGGVGGTMQQVFSTVTSQEPSSFVRLASPHSSPASMSPSPRISFM